MDPRDQGISQVPSSAPKKRFPAQTAVLVILLIAAAGAGYWWYSNEVRTPTTQTPSAYQTGTVELQKGNFTEAEAHFREALRLAKNSDEEGFAKLQLAVSLFLHDTKAATLLMSEVASSSTYTAYARAKAADLLATWVLDARGGVVVETLLTVAPFRALYDKDITSMETFDRRYFARRIYEWSGTNLGAATPMTYLYPALWYGNQAVLVSTGAERKTYAANAYEDYKKGMAALASPEAVGGWAPFYIGMSKVTAAQVSMRLAELQERGDLTPDKNISFTYVNAQSAFKDAIGYLDEQARLGDNNAMLWAMRSRIWYIAFLAKHMQDDAAADINEQVAQLNTYGRALGPTGVTSALFFLVRHDSVPTNVVYIEQLNYLEKAATKSSALKAFLLEYPFNWTSTFDTM